MGGVTGLVVAGLAEAGSRGRRPRLQWLLAALALAGCSRPSAPAPVGTDVLRISQRNEPTDLDPATASLPDEFFIIRALAEGLVIPGPDNGAPVAGAAESWEASPDGLTWTFHLRSDGRWSNGEPVTSDDFIASFRRVLGRETAAPKADLLFMVKNARDYYQGRLPDFGSVGFRAPDDLTLVVTLGQPTPQFLDYAASGPWIPVNPRAVARAGRLWTLPENDVGNGPYVLTEWQPDRRIVVRKNPRYHGAASIRLGEVQFVRFDDGGAEERAYRAGQIDVTMTVPFSDLDAFARERPAEFHQAPLAETRYLAFNTRRRPLDDPRVRRALSAAIDRSEITGKALRGGQIPAGRLLPPSIAAPEGDAPFEGGGTAADIAAAQGLLAEAGFPGGRGFPRLVLSGWDASPALDAIQAMWKTNLGVDAEIEIRDAKSHIAALRAGAYDIGFITIIPDVPDPLAILENFATGSPNNYPHWSDAGFDALLDRAARAGDSGQRAALLRQAEQRLMSQCPLAPVYFNAHSWLMRPEVRGWHEDGLWTRYYPDLWLEAAQR